MPRGLNCPREEGVQCPTCPVVAPGTLAMHVATAHFVSLQCGHLAPLGWRSLGVSGVLRDVGGT